MTNPATQVSTQPPCLRRSIGAILLGFVAVFALSLVTDQVLHMLKVYPPWGQPMPQPELNLLALSYRIVYGVLGGYIAARLAPRNPVRHAVILGVIGLVLGTAAAIATIPMNLGPAWYPIALAITALPCSWLGGVLYQNKGTAPRP
jgi:hypothetical protein